MIEPLSYRGGIGEIWGDIGEICLEGDRALLVVLEIEHQQHLGDMGRYGEIQGES